MSQFKLGQRVTVHALNEAGEVEPKPLHTFAAVVGSYAEIQPFMADAESRKNEYLIATLNKDLEVNFFTGYIDAKCLKAIEGLPLVEGLFEELEDSRDELETDANGEVFLLIRDDLDGGEFESELYEGDLQLVRVMVDDNIVGILPSESLSAVAYNLGATTGESPVLKSLEGLMVECPNEHATDEEAVCFIPQVLPPVLALHRDQIVELGFKLADFQIYKANNSRIVFKELVENVDAPSLPGLKIAHFETMHGVLAELGLKVDALAEECRLTPGSDVVMTFETYIGNISEWEEFGLDDEDDEDEDEEDDEDEDDFEEEDDEDEEPSVPQLAPLSDENVQAAHDTLHNAAIELFNENRDVMVIGTKTLEDGDVAVVMLMVANPELPLEEAHKRFDSIFEYAGFGTDEDEEEDDEEEDFSDEDRVDLIVELSLPRLKKIAKDNSLPANSAMTKRGLAELLVSLLDPELLDDLIDEINAGHGTAAN